MQIPSAFPYGTEDLSAAVRDRSAAASLPLLLLLVVEIVVVLLLEETA